MNEKQDKIVKLMQSNKIKPIDGYKMLKRNYNQMTKSEKTTDYCRAVLDLEEFDAVSFMDSFIK